MNEKVNFRILVYSGKVNEFKNYYLRGIKEADEMTKQEFMKEVQRVIQIRIKQGEVEYLNEVVNDLQQKMAKVMAEYNNRITDLVEGLETCRAKAEELGAEDLRKRINKLMEIGYANSIPLGCVVALRGEL